MQYKFYFDESFHTRKVTKSSFDDTDYFNSYLSTGMGIKSNAVSKVFRRYKIIEKKYKNFYGTTELKSEIINKKHYKFGLNTFSRIEVELYTEYFSFLIDNDILYYISCFDKLEYLLSQCKYKPYYFLNDSAVIYSIVKLINVYRPAKVIEDVLNNSNELIVDLKKFAIKQLRTNGKIELKTEENKAIINILNYLDFIDTLEINNQFDYSFTYRGLKKLIEEIGLNDVIIIIDKEATGNICKSAKMVGFSNTRQMDSKKSSGIRISDMFCGFISRVMRAIYEDTKNNPEVIYNEKHVLSEKWFELNKQKFDLYKLIAKYLKKYSNIYYCSFVGIYFDLFDEFVGLIYYIDDYANFDKYIKRTAKEHVDQCNDFLVERVFYNLKRMELGSERKFL